MTTNNTIYAELARLEHALHAAEDARTKWKLGAMEAESRLRQAESKALALSTALRALVEKWRQEAEQHKTHGDSYRRGQGWGLSDCATELEALLREAQ